MTNCYSTTYAYAGAKNDLKGRGFLGFSSIVATDVQTGIVTTTNYHTDFPYLGMIASQTRVIGSVTLSSIIYTYSATNEGGSGAGAAYYFVAPTQSVSTSTDEDFSTGLTYSMPTVTTNYTAYDTCSGEPTSIGISVSDGSSQTITSQYSCDQTNWIIGLVTRTQTQSVVGS